ncbi:MAG: membrane dipeptidase [Clostridia bacterium]|nr:membrane dipeptidase [Clostridia bacterium]
MRLFDLHCDTLSEATDTGAALAENSLAIDLRRGRRYENWTQTFAAFLPDGLSVTDARRRCATLLDTAEDWRRACTEYRPVLTAADLRDETAICRALLSIENGGVLAADYTGLAALHCRGVRMVGMTWNGDNTWGCGCFGSDEGLTAAGEQAVRDLEALSIVVDVSHLNTCGFYQLEKLAKSPFVATHSNAAAVCPHPRNLTDEQFGIIRDRGGLVGLNLYGEHLGGWDFAAVQRHLEHFLSMDGERTVCFGTDLDGMTIPPTWNGIAIMQGLWQYLRDRGYPDTLLDAVFYENARAFFARVLENT